MNHVKTLFPACVTNGKGKMYYVTHIEHAIKELDLEKLKVRYIENPEDYVPIEWTGVDKLIIKNDNLYLFEQNGKRLLEYSLLKKTCRYFDLRYDMYNCGNWSICTIYNNVIFAFPSFMNKVIKINLVSGEIEDKEELCSNINYIFGQEKSRFISKNIEIDMLHKLYSCGCQVRNDIWLFAERKGFVLKYELLTENCIQYLLPTNINGCIHAIWKRETFYILSAEGNLYSWNFRDEKTEMLFNSKNKYQYPYFGKIAVTDSNVWMIPAFGDEICIVDLKEGKNIVYSAYPEDFNYYEDPYMSKFYDYSEDEKNYYFAMHCANYILIIEKTSGKEKWVRPIEPDLSEKIKYYKTLNLQEYEEGEFGINGFFMLLDQWKNSIDAIKKKKVGENMWRILK